jgi:uncharacterized membrane protein (DUF2068 family)
VKLRARAPGVEHRNGWRPDIHWELLACGWHGHHLIGVDADEVGPEHAALVRQAGDQRWHRCLRCDAWMFVPAPPVPSGTRIPERSDIDLPLRGRPLRDRFVLRLIALDRVIHVLVLGVLTAAIFVFAAHRTSLRGDYTRILNDLGGGLGGPVNQSSHGFLGDLNKLFTVSTTELYAIAAALGAYTFVLAIEAVGLWFQRRWAEYLTFVETTVLVPIEIYELTTRVSPLKIVTLVLNLAVVIYLAVAKRLFGIRGGARAAEAERTTDSGWDAVDRATPPPWPQEGDRTRADAGGKILVTDGDHQPVDGSDRDAAGRSPAPEPESGVG